MRSGAAKHGQPAYGQVCLPAGPRLGEHVGQQPGQDNPGLADGLAQRDNRPDSFLDLSHYRVPFANS